jgi:hypothetical protein
MRRLLLLAMLLLLGSTAWAAPTFATCNTNAFGVASINCTLGSLGASHLVIFATQYSNTGTGAVTETLSDNNSWFTFTELAFAQYTDGARTQQITLWCGYTGAHTGSDTFKVTFSGSDPVAGMNVSEETDVTFTSCAAAFDNSGTGSGIGVGTGSGTGTFTFSTAGASSTNTGDNLIGWCEGNVGAGTILPATGFTQIKAGIPSQRPVLFYKTEGAPGSYVGSCTSTATANYAIVMALFCSGDCVAASTAFPYIALVLP